MVSTSNEPLSGYRKELRQRLLAARERFVAGPDFAAADASLARHLTDVLAQLEPERLGLYWPMRSEFNAAAAIAADSRLVACALALPCTRRTPREMDFRAWDGSPPAHRDECNIATSDGAVVVPDVVLAPCVGFIREGGYRLGYGGGYFDRWLAAHPHATAVGVAWAAGQIDDGAFTAEPHDRPLALIVTEHGVV